MGMYLWPNSELVVGKYPAPPPYSDEVYAALVVGQYSYGLLNAEAVGTNAGGWDMKRDAVLDMLCAAVTPARDALLGLVLADILKLCEVSDLWRRAYLMPYKYCWDWQ
jgi:hypothetical protein